MQKVYQTEQKQGSEIFISFIFLALSAIEKLCICFIQLFPIYIFMWSFSPPTGLISIHSLKK